MGPSRGSLGAFLVFSYRLESGFWPPAVSACPIRAGFVARGEAEATETRLKWVEHVVEGVGGERGTIGSVAGAFLRLGVSGTGAGWVGTHGVPR